MHDDSQTDGAAESGGRTTGPHTSRRDVLKATGAGAIATGLGVGATGSASASDERIPTPWLHVEGNKVYDPLGNEVILRGLNIPDPKRLDHTVSARGKNWDHMIDLATDEDRGWYANVIRVPVHPGDIAELPPVPEADVDVHVPPTFTQAELLEYCEEYLDDVVEYCREQGVYCIVDYHRHWGEGELDWRNEDLDEEVRMFWDTVAPRYGDQSHVIFEVYNEPTLPAMYLATGGPYDWYDEDAAGMWRMWKQVAQPWVDIIREHAPENLVIVGTPGWSAMPEGAQIEEFDGGNLMYAYHIYGGHGLESDADFDSREAEEGTAEVWRDVPLFMTEFGWQPNIGRWISGTTDGFGSAVSEWADDRPIHWTAWCFDITWLPTMWDRAFVDGDPDDSVGDPYSGDIPQLCEEPPCEWDLLGRDAGEYDEQMGEYIREFLEDRADDDVPQIGHPENPPAPPASVDVDAVGATEATISWSEVSPSGDNVLDRYEVAVDGTVLVETEDTSATVDRLYADSSHEIAVTAVDVHGQRSGAATTTVSTDSSAAGAPGQPEGLAVVDRDFESVTVEWDGATGDVVEFVVHADGVEVSRSGADDPSAHLDDLDVGGRYDLAITAVGPNRDESEPLEAVVEPIPAGADPDDDTTLLVNDYTHDGALENNALGGWMGGGMLDGIEDGAAVMTWEDHVYHATEIELPDGDAGDYDYVRFLARGEAGMELSILEVDFGDLSSEPFGDLTDDRIGQDWSVVSVPLEVAGTVEGQIQIEGAHDTFGEFRVDEIWLAAEDDPANGLVDAEGGTGPSAPRDLSADAVTETSVELSWGSVADAEAYNVYVDGDHYAETTTTSYEIDGLEAGTTYELGVESVSADGTSLTRELAVTTDGSGGTDEEPCEEAGAEDGEELGNGDWVCDLDGDGNYRDLTASGDTTIQDLQHFFENQHRDPYDSRTDLFDFTGNGDVGQPDVVDLFHEI